MAAGKTKKVNEYQAEKQRRLHLINAQKDKNERMFSLLGIGHLYPLINERGKLVMALVRISTTLIQAAPGCNDKRTKEAVEYIKQAFKSFETSTELTLLTGEKITIREFRTTLNTIFFTFLMDDVNMGTHTQLIKKEVYDLFLKYTDLGNKVNQQSTDFFDDICTHISSLKYGIYYPKETFKNKHQKSLEDSWSTSPVFLFNREIPNHRQLNFDGKKREVYQMGFPEFDKGVRWTTVASERLGLPYGKSYPCYIQQHAIVRLTERIGIFSESVSVFQACLSLEQGKVLRMPNSEAFYFELKILNIKLGYLITYLIDEMLVVKTFIFVTQSGSPEGKRIEAAMGLKRDDKDYIGMSTLKGFLSEDVAKNPKMAILLEKSGCADLLNAYEVFSKKVNIKGMQATGRIITQYLEKSWQPHKIESMESYSSDHLAIVPLLPPQPAPQPEVVLEELEEMEMDIEMEAPTSAPPQKPVSKRRKIIALLLLPVLIPLLLLVYLILWIKNGFKPIKVDNSTNDNAK